MSRNDSTAFFTFLVGIGVGAAAVILLGSKRIDQLHDDVSEALNDGMKELKRQTQKTVNTARQKLQEAIDIGCRRLQRSPKVVTPSYLIADA